MAVSDIEAVLDFLRNNGLSDSESALIHDIVEKSEMGSYDYQRFLFPMVPPPPPLKITVTRRQPEVPEGVHGSKSSSDSSDEFVSLGSSTTDLCSSEFTNPYGIRTATGASSQASSDRLSEFGTARDYHDFDMQNDLCWYKEKDEEYAMPPCFGGPDLFAGPSEDKFVMSVEMEKQSDSRLGLNELSEGSQSVERTNDLDKPWPFPVTSMDDVKPDAQVTDCYHLDEHVQLEAGIGKGKQIHAVSSCSTPFCVCCADAGAVYGSDPSDHNLMNFKETDINDFQYSATGENPKEFNSSFKDKTSKSCNYSVKRSSTFDLVGDFKNTSNFQSELLVKDFYSNLNDGYESGYDKGVVGEPHELDATAVEEGVVTPDEFLIDDTNEDEYEVFNLRIIHRKNRLICSKQLYSFVMTSTGLVLK